MAAASSALRRGWSLLNGDFWSVAPRGGRATSTTLPNPAMVIHALFPSVFSSPSRRVSRVRNVPGFDYGAATPLVYGFVPCRPDFGGVFRLSSNATSVGLFAGLMLAASSRGIVAGTGPEWRARCYDRDHHSGGTDAGHRGRRLPRLLGLYTLAVLINAARCCSPPRECCCARCSRAGQDRCRCPSDSSCPLGPLRPAHGWVQAAAR